MTTFMTRGKWKNFLLVLVMLPVWISASEDYREIFVYPAPQLVDKDKRNNSVYGFVDLPENYQKLYSFYKKNTEAIENPYFSEKISVWENQKNNEQHYHLIFRHWFAGELFRFMEEHKKIEKALWKNTSDQSFVAFAGEKKADIGIKQADMWTIKKYLLEKSKSSYVEEDLQYMEMNIAFIKISPQKTRVYFHLVVNAKNQRNHHQIALSLRSNVQEFVQHWSNHS